MSRILIRLQAAMLLWLFCLATNGHAQGVPFQILVQQGSSTLSVPNNATLNFPVTAVGGNSRATITLTYQGATSAVVAAPQIFGTGGFTLANPGTFPATMKPGDSTSFAVQYTASTSAQAVGQLQVPYNEAAATPTGTSTNGLISMVLNGTAPDLVVSYALPTDGNTVTLSTGSTITFPPTVVGSSVTATIFVANRGSGSGSLQSLSKPADPAFAVLSAPLLPLTIPSGTSAQFSLRYAPLQTGSDSDTWQVVLSDRTVSANLQGTALTSLLSYQLLQDAGNAPLAPNQTVSFPDTAVGGKSSISILVKSIAIVPITLSNASATGTFYSITDGPIFPINLNPNDTFVLTITFAPTQPGKQTGRLRVGNDTFNLSATGIGTQLVYSYGVGSNSATVLPGGTVPFSPLAVGQSSTLTLTIQNTGTSSATVTSIGVSDPRSVFTLGSSPNLPQKLDPGQSVQFSVQFAPITTGLATGNLVVDAQQFTLAGFGNAPPPIPSYQFTGASGNQPAMSQPAVGLSLASTYPMELDGKVTLTVDSGNLPADPAVQFAVGGRTVSFIIPANTTQAVFAGGGTQIKLQTGSVAGTITLTPSFALPSGLDVTPATPVALNLVVPAVVLQLQNALVAQSAQNSLALQITGYATTRSISALQFQFQAQASANLPTSKISVSVQAPAVAWFDTSQSQSFGGQFLITVPFTVQSDQTSSVTTPVSMLQSVSISGSNELGNSNTVVVPLSQ